SRSTCRRRATRSPPGRVAPRAGSSMVGRVVMRLADNEVGKRAGARLPVGMEAVPHAPVATVVSGAHAPGGAGSPADARPAPDPPGRERVALPPWRVGTVLPWMPGS